MISRFTAVIAPYAGSTTCLVCPVNSAVSNVNNNFFYCSCSQGHELEALLVLNSLLVALGYWQYSSANLTGLAALYQFSCQACPAAASGCTNGELQNAENSWVFTSGNGNNSVTVQIANCPVGYVLE